MDNMATPPTTTIQQFKRTQARSPPRTLVQRTTEPSVEHHHPPSNIATIRLATKQSPYLRETRSRTQTVPIPTPPPTRLLPTRLPSNISYVPSRLLHHLRIRHQHHTHSSSTSANQRHAAHAPRRPYQHPLTSNRTGNLGWTRHPRHRRLRQRRHCHVLMDPLHHH
jgi:hypothetical protein